MFILFFVFILKVFKIFFFFFSSRRRHTRCGRDWNSDVCSSDLARSHVGHHLPVKLDAELLETPDELAVGESVQARTGADADDPQAAEITLLALAAAIGEPAGAIGCFLHRPVQFALGEEIALGELGEFLAFGAAHSAALDSRHGVCSFSRDFYGAMKAPSRWPSRTLKAGSRE